MSDSKQTYWNPDRIMKLIIGLGIGTGLVWLVNRLSDVLLPFFLACLIAYLLEPLVEFNQRWMHTRRRFLPSMVTLIDVTVVIGFIIYLFVPSTVRQLDMLGGILSDISKGDTSLPPFYKTAINFISRHFDPNNLKEMISMDHLEALVTRGTSLLEESIDVLMRALEWLMTFIYVLFILIDYPVITRGFKLIIPHRYRDRGMMVMKDVEVSMDHYFRGQGLVALCAAVFYCVGFSIVGIPLAIPLGLLVGLLYMIPYFQYVTLIPVSAVCFIYSLGGTTEFLPEFGKCLLVYVFSQCVCDYIITPHVMGREMGLNPAVILLSLSVWGSLFGIIGMVIALPVTALIMSYYKRYISMPGKDVPAEADTEAADAKKDEERENL